MCDIIQNKFFTNKYHNAFCLPEDHSVMIEYGANGKKEIDNLPLLGCLTHRLLHIIANTHNHVMNSDHSQMAKFGEVIALSAASLLIATPLAVVETIVRFVPGLIAAIYLFAMYDEKDESSKEDESIGIGTFCVMGPITSAISIAVAVQLGCNMMTAERPYYVAKLYDEFVEYVPD